jgi:hypothetical protein
MAFFDVPQDEDLLPESEKVLAEYQKASGDPGACPNLADLRPCPQDRRGQVPGVEEPEP